jgi:hypothetical protein
MSLDNYSEFKHNLWNQFISARNREEYFYHWLVLQCSLIPCAVQGVLFLFDPVKGAYAPVSKWPDDGQNPERLTEIAERVIEEKCGLLVELNQAGLTASAPLQHYGAAYPFFISGNLHGLVAIEIKPDREEQLAGAMGQLQWGAGWLELFFLRKQTEDGETLLTNLKSAVDMMALVLGEKAFSAACMVFVTQLAVFLKCDRVSLAFMGKTHSRIQAISHSSQVGERMNLIRSIEMAMDEAIIRRKEISYPLHDNNEVIIIRNHEQLARQYGAGFIFTMPFHGEGKYLGALTMERPSGQGFSEEEINVSRSIASLVFPVLETKRQKDRNPVLQLMDSARTESLKLLGSGYPGRKMLAFLFILLILFFSVKMGDYKVSAVTTIEGKVKRVIVAPFEGYLKESPVRAGDTVDEGALMCAMDDRDLRLERLNLISKQTQYQRQYQEAFAGHSRADAEIIKSQLDQSVAQLDLVESKIERTKITAPFRGIILSGDLSQRLGGSTEKGEVLFEIAPLDSYRITLEVDERYISDIKIGQKGHMILSSLPRENFDFIVERITPISIPKSGMNYFKVEAGSTNISESLRPGMSGIGKIFVERRKLIDVWTRDLRNWLSMRIWAWWP